MLATSYLDAVAVDADLAKAVFLLWRAGVLDDDAALSAFVKIADVGNTFRKCPQKCPREP